MSRALVTLAILALSSVSSSGQDAPPTIEPYKTVQGRRLNIHVFAPAETASSPRPAAVLLHGGGWISGTPTWTYGPAREYASRGIVAFAVEYRLSDRKTVTPADAVEDTRDAVRWVRTHAKRFNVDPGRIIGHGVSAGGHLAVIAAEMDDASAPNALVLWSPGVAAAEDPFFQGLMGDAARLPAVSAIDRVRRGMAPTIVISGARDVVTPDDAARRFCAKVKNVGTRCEVHTYENVGHLLSSRLEPKDQYGGNFAFEPKATADAEAQVWRFLRDSGFVVK